MTRSVVSKILQQPLDVIELDLRTRGIAEAAAEFFEDAADALGVDLAGDLDRVVVAELAAVKRATERIGLIAAAVVSRRFAAALSRCGNTDPGSKRQKSFSSRSM